jgi:hypothetical protein
MHGQDGQIIRKENVKKRAFLAGLKLVHALEREYF